MTFRLYFVPYKEIQRGVLREHDQATDTGEAADTFEAHRLACEMRKRNTAGICYACNSGGWIRMYWFKNSSLNRVRSNVVDINRVPKQIRALELLRE